LPGYTNLTVDKVVGWLGRQDALRAKAALKGASEDQEMYRLCPQ